MKNFILSLVIVSFLGSCGTGTPSCTDSAVTQLAKEIFEEENNVAFRHLLISIIEKDPYMDAQDIFRHDFDSEDGKLATLVWNENVSYEFVNIRIETANDKIKKCECAAEMEFTISADGLNKLGIEEDNVFRTQSVLFDAQNTDDGLLVWFQIAK